MVAMVPMDKTVPFLDQLRSGAPGPITLVNLFNVPPEDEAQFLALWQDDAAFMLGHGCTSAQLHKGVAGSTSFLNVAQWPDVATLARAFGDPVFQGMISRYPPNVTASPLVMKKFAVPGICGD